MPRGFPGSSDGKEYTCHAGDSCSIPGSRRSPGEGHSNPLQYSCLGNSMDRGAWRATIHEDTESEVTARRSTHAHVNTELIHFAVQKKLIQHCKATILQ